MKLEKFAVPSNIELLLGIAQVRKVADVDAYRDRDDNGPAPYRCRVNGALLRTKAGAVRKFRSLGESIKASEA